jgi:protein involved in polysaccharide export with SLBB domain
LGPINLLGLSFSEAKDLIEKKVEAELIGTKAFLSLQELRSISVYLLGQAYKPGKYTMSGLSTVTNALFISGGVNKEGSLRNIKIKRGDKVIKKFDFYDLLNGSLKSDERLQDGDVVFIPFIENRVKLGGSFKRPHIYEFIPGETVKDAVKLAGGLKSDVLDAKLEISSVNKDLYERSLSYANVNSNLKLRDRDSINVNSTSGIKVQTIKISGEVVNPGEFSIQKGDTILSIIERAGGYTEDSFPEGGVYLRKSIAEQQKEGFKRTADELEKTLVNIVSAGDVMELTEFAFAPITNLIEKLRSIEPVGRQVADLTWLSLKTDPYKNFKVRNGDQLHIPQRPNSISVLGEVLNPSTLRYEPSFSLEDYLSLSGGLTDQADRSKILIISPSGQARTPRKTLFARNSNEILPGSTVVVTRDSKPWDAIKLTEVITPILADLATSAAAIAAISD